ncbi:hypothetical protein TNCT_589681 [Trichonephila clavata]|uniref:Uncharacterized protein n=1 Tax=Trichonephila clavata TaxID=2740835 RepID=A0A8X6IMI3_TRICU|nr:hypothetical protein TNCT_589681 [Trichonephila clavata]
MEGIDGNVCIQKDADSSLQNMIKKTPKLIVKKVRLTKIASKHRRNEKSKKEILDAKKNILATSDQNFVHQNITSGILHLPTVHFLERCSFKYEMGMVAVKLYLLV